MSTMESRIDRIQRRLGGVWPSRNSGSLFVRHIDGGSTNLIEAELLSLTSVVYDVGRFGVSFVSSPVHADVLLISGPLTRNMLTPALSAWRVMPSPKGIVTVGDWYSGDLVPPVGLERNFVLDGSYAVVDLPRELQGSVLATVAGDPPSPDAIGQALLEAMDELKASRKRRSWRHAVCHCTRP